MGLDQDAFVTDADLIPVYIPIAYELIMTLLLILGERGGKGQHIRSAEFSPDEQHGS